MKTHSCGADSWKLGHSDIVTENLEKPAESELRLNLVRCDQHQATGKVLARPKAELARAVQRLYR